MPVQKGKKRKRERHRAVVETRPERAPSVPPQPGRERPKIMRRGKPAPLWVNVGFGCFMLVAGVAFYLSGIGAPHGGHGSSLLLVLYLLLAGFYLARAARQYFGARRT